MDSAMTLQEAKSIARHLGLTLRKVRSGDYRVNFRDGNQMTAYYTDSLEDAANTAVEMARKRGGVSCTNVMTAAYALVEATNKCLAKNNGAAPEMRPREAESNPRDGSFE